MDYDPYHDLELDARGSETEEMWREQELMGLEEK